MSCPGGHGHGSSRADLRRAHCSPARTPGTPSNSDRALSHCKAIRVQSNAGTADFMSPNRIARVSIKQERAFVLPILVVCAMLYGTDHVSTCSVLRCQVYLTPTTCGCSEWTNTSIRESEIPPPTKRSANPSMSFVESGAVYPSFSNHSTTGVWRTPLSLFTVCSGNSLRFVIALVLPITTFRWCVNPCRRLLSLRTLTCRRPKTSPNRLPSAPRPSARHEKLLAPL